ncbi:sensor histidine kinase, partial [Paenibacillus sp. MCAF20]
MMVRFLRSGKWELIAMFVAASVVSFVLAAVTWSGLKNETPMTEVRLGAASVFLLVSVVFGYWAAQRIQRRIDT